MGALAGMLAVVSVSSVGSPRVGTLAGVLVVALSIFSVVCCQSAMGMTHSGRLGARTLTQGQQLVIWLRS